MDFSIELRNQDTNEIKVVSFDSEEKRSKFIQDLPGHIDWNIFENMNLFSVDKELSLG